MRQPTTGSVLCCGRRRNSSEVSREMLGDHAHTNTHIHALAVRSQLVCARSKVFMTIIMRGAIRIARDRAHRSPITIAYDAHLNRTQTRRYRPAMRVRIPALVSNSNNTRNVLGECECAHETYLHSHTITIFVLCGLCHYDFTMRSHGASFVGGYRFPELIYMLANFSEQRYIVTFDRVHSSSSSSSVEPCHIRACTRAQALRPNEVAIIRDHHKMRI